VATYPTGVYAPASKSAGQTIQASFFNDPDAEITAVEDALKNGIPHNVSITGTLAVAGATTISTGGLTVSTGSVNVGGPSSLTTLQVTGGSTFAGRVVCSSGVTVAGGSTFTGPVVFSTTVTFATLPNIVTPSVFLQLSANVALSTSAEVCPNWDVQVWNNAGMHSTSVNSSRITFADSTGLYEVGFVGVVVSSTNCFIRARMRVSDTSAGPFGSAQQVTPGVANTMAVTCIGVVRAASTSDYVTVRLLAPLSSVATLHAGSSGGNTTFWARKVSA
jgi:hypothetical protein